MKREAFLINHLVIITILGDTELKLGIQQSIQKNPRSDA